MPNIFKEFQADDAHALADFLLGNIWPFHGGSPPARETILKRVEDGVYWSDSQRAFWIIDEATGEKVGLVHLREIGDGAPLFDLRIASEHRGRGIGLEALGWLTGYVFEHYPSIHRIEGYTRQDNIAMRRTFRKGGYIKEAHHRQAWGSSDGTRYDAIGYAIIRHDWKEKTTTPLTWNDE